MREKIKRVGVVVLASVCLFTSSAWGSAGMAVKAYAAALKSVKKASVSIADFKLTGVTNKGGISFIKRKAAAVGFSFHAKGSDKANIKSVKIDGKTCAVKRGKASRGGYLYTGKAALPEKVGTSVKVKMTEITAKDGAKAKVSRSVRAQVLKEKPAIKHLKFYKSGKTMKVSFEAYDPDHAVKSGTIQVSGNKKVKISSKKVKSGKNTVTLKNLKDGTSCKITLKANYDLDGKAKNKSYQGTITAKNRKIQFNKSAKASVSKVTAKVDRKEKLAIVTFSASVKPKNLKVTGIVAGGKDYEAKRSGSRYTAKIPCKLDKQQTFKITHVVLSNYQQVKVKAASVTVFKKDPVAGANVKLSGANVSDHYPQKGEAVNVTFAAAPKDAQITRAMIGGKEYAAVKQADGSYLVSFSAPDTAGKHKVVIESVTVKGKTVATNFEAGEIDVLKDKPTVADGDLSYDQQSREISLRITDKDNAMTSGSMTVLDAQDKSVMDGPLAKGRHDYRFDAKKLSAGTYRVSVAVNYDLDSDPDSDSDPDKEQHSGTATFKAEAVVNDSAPKVTDLAFAIKDGKVSAQFKLEDTDKVLTALHASLYDATGTSLETVEIPDLTPGAKKVDFKHTEAGTYKVAVLANYKNHDGVELNGKTLAEAEDEVAIKPVVNRCEVSPKYAEKGEDITLTYDLSDNTTDLKPTKFVVNGKEYTASETKDGKKYTVTMKAPKDAGKVTLETTAAVYGKNTTVALDKTDTAQFEVLKDAPDIRGYIVDREKKTLRFQVVDRDDALIGGQAIVGEGEEDASTYNFLDANEQSVTIPDTILSDQKEHKVSIKLTYDRDIDRRDGSDNYQKDQAVRTQTIGGTDTGEDVEIEDVKVTSVDKDSKTVGIEFKAANDEKGGHENTHIRSVYIGGEEYETKHDHETDVYTLAEDLKYTGEDNEKQTFHIDQALLGNGTLLDLSGQKTEFAIFREKPAVDNLSIRIDGRKVDVDYTLTDQNGDVGKLHTILKRDVYNTVYGITETREIDKKGTDNPKNGSGHVQLELPDIDEAYDFTVAVAADYDIADGERHAGEVLGEQSGEVKIRADILTDSLKTTEDLGGDVVAETITKNQKMRLAFEISDNTDAEATAMEINGRTYTVNKDRPTDKGDIYLADVYAPNTAGNQAFQVSKIIYGKKEATVNYQSGTRVIQKEKPQLADYEDGGFADEPYLKFTFKDVDQTHTGDVTFNIKKENGDVVYTQTLQEQDYEIDLKDEHTFPDGIYTVEAIASYNTSEDDDPKAKVENADLLADNVLKLPKRLQIKRGLHFKASLIAPEVFIGDMPMMFGITVEDIRDDLKKEDEKGSLIKGFKLAKVREKNGKYKKVREEEFTGNPDDKRQIVPWGDMMYHGLINGWKTEQGLTYIYYESITLCDDTEVVLDWFSNYTILKTYPEVAKTSLKEDTINNKVTATADITDKDHTINRLHFRLKAADGRVLGEKFWKKDEIPSDSVSTEFNSAKMPMTTRYNLDVIVEYDAMGRGDFTQQTMGTAFVNSAERVIVKDHRVENPYPKKGEKVTLEYDLADNLASGIDIIGAMINGEKVDVAESNGETYKFEVEAPLTSGVYDYTATGIVLSNKTFNLDKKETEDGQVIYNHQPTDTVDVLKDTPRISNLSITDDPGKGEAQFKFDLNDPDDALGTDAGVAKVGNSVQKIQEGENTVTFTGLAQDEMMSMDVLANYSLDSGEVLAKNMKSVNGNSYTEHSILSEPVKFMLLSDYELDISGMEAQDANGDAATYFEKGTTVNLEFTSTNKAKIPLKQVVIDGNAYDVEQDEDGAYHAKVKGYADAGEHDLAIEQAVLVNGKRLNAEGIGDPATIEVLKDAVSVDKMSYTASTGSSGTSMTLTVNMKDADDSLEKETADIFIKDAESKQVVETAQIKPNKETSVTFATGYARKFDISVTADYKRTIAGTDLKKGQEIYKKTIAKDSRAIEMKSIQDARLYKVENNTRILKDTVTKEELTEAKATNNLKSYVLGISMKDMPTFYSVLEDVEAKTVNDENALVLKISYEGAVDYSGEQPNKEHIEVVFVELQPGEYAYEGSFATLLARMRANTSGEFTLEKDYDASTYTPNTLSYFGSDAFKGKLNGNGYSISNLDRPLFENLSGATVQNLYLLNAQLATAENEKAVLAHTASGVTTKNIFADTVKITASGGVAVGGLFLDVKDSSTISECSVTNLTVNGNYVMQKAAAIASTIQKSTISNCYAQGMINSGWWGNGGIVGQADNTSVIDHCVSNVSLSPYFGKGSGYEKSNGGNIVGAARGVKLSNNISIADKNSANAYKIHNGNEAIHTASSGNYFVADTPGIDQEEQGIARVESKNLNETFYKNTLQLDPGIWNLTGASATKIPRLKANRLASPYVPSYDRMKDNKAYDASKETAYNNLYKLAPFYDASYILEDVKKIPADSSLNTKLIQGIIPYNADGKIVYALDTNNYNQISKIRLVFTDRTMEEHPVKYDITLGDVACYDIIDLKLKYNYNHYIVNANSPLVNELVEELYNAGDYATALEGITPNKDPYTYQWFYDENIHNKKVLKDFVIKVLANGNYTVTTGNTMVSTAIREELTENGRLMRMLYAYNYYMRWYNFDIGRFNVADMLMFKGEIFGSMLTFDTLTDTLLSNPGSTMNAGATDSYYSNYLSVYTGIPTLPEFLNFFIRATGSYSDVNDWFTNHFKGELIEIEMDKIEGVDIAYDKLKYRAWEHLSARPNLMLPMIMIPEDGAYIISMPTIMAFGSQKTYVRDIVAQKDDFRKSMQGWANALKTYYNMYLGILSDKSDGWDVVENFNKRDDYINDTTAIYENPTDEGRSWADLKNTKDVYYKWFGEPTGKAYYHSGNYAAANGKDIFYAQGQFFGNMILFSHEGAHNHDGPLFFRGHGRRSGTGAETYTTNFFTQSFEEGSLQINGYYHWNEKEERATNLDPSEINTPKKIHNFYKNALDTSSLLDYIAGEAFLTLTPDEQATIVSQCPDENHIDGTRVMPRVTKEDIEKMKLGSVNDLIDHRLDLMNGVGGKWAYSVRWYEPHSATSVVSDDVFQYLAYVMLGYAGYNNGFVQYCGNIHKNDNAALQEISRLAGDNYKTFDDFRKGEFKKLAAKKEKIAVKGVNAEAIKQAFIDAMKADAAAQDRAVTKTVATKKKFYQMLKKGTGDFSESIFSESAK